MRAWSYPEYTKIVIEADREIGFSSRRLSQPERLYLDLQNAKIKEELKKDPITVGDGLKTGKGQPAYPKGCKNSS